MKNIKWGIRLLFWFIIIFVKASDEDASEYEIFSGAIWSGLGTFLVIAPLAVYLWTIDGAVFDINYSKALFICFFLYILLGVVSFFSERKTNAPIPWQDNGRW